MMYEDTYESLDIALRQAEKRIAQLEVALVERQARLEWYEEDGRPPVTFDGEFIRWEQAILLSRKNCTADARRKLEELGLLTKLQNGAN